MWGMARRTDSSGIRARTSSGCRTVHLPRSYPGTSSSRIPEPDLLYTVAVVLLLLWLLGFLTDAAMGGFIHILLVVAIVLILVRLISGSRR